MTFDEDDNLGKVRDTPTIANVGRRVDAMDDQEEPPMTKDKSDLANDPLEPIVIVTNTLQNFVCTRILEPTVDLTIVCSIVTSCSIDAFELPAWIGSVGVTCSHMLSLQQVHECILLRKLGQEYHIPSILCLCDVQSMSIVSAHSQRQFLTF